MPYKESDRIVDELLVLHVLRGDQRAVDRLGARWQPRLLSVAFYLTRNEEMAKDAAQDAWVGICRNWPTLRDPSKFSPWAFGILRRKCVDLIRTNMRSADRNADIDPIGHLLDAANFEDATAIRQAFSALSPDHCAAAYLFFVEGLTLDEIAAAADVPLGTVKSRIFHARRQLKARLSGDKND